MTEFVEALDEINSLAEQSPGFVWRLQSDQGHATAFRPFDEDILVNLSVWETLDHLHAYVYQGAHRTIMRQRH